MNKENTQKLLRRFPKLFRAGAPQTDTLVPTYGFEHCDGWFQVIWDLCEKIEPLAEDSFYVVQVKEKFGGLRFYTEGKSKDFEETCRLIRIAERLADKTCEFCGAPGELRNKDRRWIRTLCDPCAEQSKDKTQV